MINKSGVGSRTKYQCRGGYLTGDNSRTVLDGSNHRLFSKDRVPTDEKESKKVRRTVARYWLLADRKLYRRSFDGPYMQCLHPRKIEELLIELHKGVCGSYVRGRSLAHRVMTQGFWWLRM